MIIKRKLKLLFKTLYYRFCDYNLFIPDENDYDEEQQQQQQQQDPTIAIRYQKYTTRIYLLLLLVCMYMLFYNAMIKPQVRTVVITDIDLNKFTELYSQYGDILSCPCSRITISYKTFVSNRIAFHSICSSFFVSQQWIEVLYMPERSIYGVADFRTTAVSQFQLLSSLCSLSQDIIFKNEIALNNKDFTTTYLLVESRIRLEVDASIQSFQSGLSTQIISFINYLRLITRANNFVTSLNTNVCLMSWYTNKLIVRGYFTGYDPLSTGNDLRCDTANPITPTAFYKLMDNLFYNPTTWSEYPPNDTLVKGFFAACTPLEALLQSTLDCLYDTDCLQLLTEYFPSINQTNLNLNDHVLQSEKTNTTVYDRLLNLFIKQWTIELNYSNYFDNCNPSTCTYTTTNIINYSYAITLFFSLYGGLIMILRLISPVLIKLIFKIKYQSANDNFFQWLKTVNLFKNVQKRTGQDIKQQKIISHIYLFVLLVSILVLILFNFLNTETIMTTIESPSLNTYIDLQKRYSDTLKCPCSTITIPYQKFMSFSPILHQICSSDLISNRWLSILREVYVQYPDLDWRNRAYQQFNLLSKLCQFVNETITSAINEFLLQSFTVSNVIFEIDFNTQLNKTLVQFYQSTIVNFYHLIEAVDLSTQVDQLFMVTLIKSQFKADSFDIQRVTANDTETGTRFEITVYPNFVQDIYSKSVKCICSTDPYCQGPSAIFDVNMATVYNFNTNFSVSYVIPGSIVGCSTMNSLLLSTMECFYSNSLCFSFVTNYTKETYIWKIEYPSWSDVRPLIHNSTLTHLDQNASILTLVKKMMIEEWNPSYLYNQFYHLCSPTHCIYTERRKTKHTIDIILIVISTIGGLTVSLRLLTPIMVRFVMKIISKIFKKQEHHQEEEEENMMVRNWGDRLKSMKKKLIVLLYDVVINLNIFPPHYYGSHIDQMSAKRLGRHTTRLYFTLLILSFTILTIYTIVQKQIITKDFNQPTFDEYNQLIQIYGEQLTCICSSIASTYDHFVLMEPIFHPICSSSFVSNELIEDLRMSLSSNLSIYEERDYRRIISTHIQYLQGLCQISIDTINNTKEQFLTTLFLTKQLLSNNEFNQSMNSSIEHVLLTASNTLTSIFLLIRDINFGNAIISTYKTNYKYYYPVLTVADAHNFQTKAVIYDDNCSCALHSNCTSQAYIFGLNSVDRIEMTGLKIGCLPSESFLSSTLECFYNVSCIDIIRSFVNLTYPLEPLSSTPSSNRSINELIQNLFIDRWLTTFDYSSYFHRCLPLSCSHSYVQKFSIIYIISFLLGLQGGLTIVLKWICPRIIEYLTTLKNYRKKRSNLVHSVQSVNTITTTTNSSVRIRSRSRLFKSILASILFIILIVLLIVFSVYIARQRINELAVISSTSMTTMVIITTDMPTTATKTISALLCPLIFETESLFSPGSVWPFLPIVEDFNNDNRLDISFLSPDIDESFTTNLIVMLGNGDGTFSMPIIFPLGYITSDNGITVIDVNQDTLLDVIIINGYAGTATIALGNGDGSFRNGSILIMDYCFSSKEIPVSDFNDDMCSDIAVVCYGDSNAYVYFGNCNGSFPTKLILATEEKNLPQAIVVADFNGDEHSDIVINNSRDRTIGVFIGYGNGSFEKQKKSFSGGGYSVSYMVTDDFNENGNQDIVVLYSATNSFRVLLGHGNGSFSEGARLIVESGLISDRIVTKDFNRDGHVDIGIATHHPYTITIYFGNGDGQFQTYILLSTETVGFENDIIAGDFNGDDYPDIMITDRDFGNVIIRLNTGQCNTSIVLD